MNWKSFALGFVVGVALLSAISYWRARPQDAIASWPDDDNKKGMQMIAPWVTEARVGNLGPFIAIVPKSFNASPEAFLHPAKMTSPWIYFKGEEILIHDSKKRAVSVDFNASTGEFRSYTFHPDLATATGPSFTDRELTGVMEKFEPQMKKR
jgi:hypothetical protein